MMRPTRRSAALFALSVPSALLIVSLWRAQWSVSLYMPVLVLACMAADAMMALPGRRVEASLTGPSRLAIGQRGAMHLTLDAGGFEGEVRIEALLELEGETDPPEVVRGTMHAGRLDLDLPLLPRRRGRVLVRAVWLRWCGPWGLVVRVRREACTQQIDVVPDIRGVQDAALLFFSRNAQHGAKTQRLKGEGTEFENLSDWSPGMDNRLIDWKRSARHRRILCKEFRQERNHQIVFGFDTGRLMSEPVNGVPKLDHAIASGLLLAWISLRGGDWVGGGAFDLRCRHFLKPGRGAPYFTRFQRFSAELDYRTDETNFTLGLAELNARLQRRTLVILFTEFVDQISAELLLESLQWMTARHAVLFVTMRDPMLARMQEAPPRDFGCVASAVVADNLVRERMIVLERIARLGVHCLDVPVAGLSAALLNRYLLIKQRGLL